MSDKHNTLNDATMLLADLWDRMKDADNGAFMIRFRDGELVAVPYKHGIGSAEDIAFITASEFSQGIGSEQWDELTNKVIKFMPGKRS